MPRRREFLIGCGCSVTVPAFAAVGLPLAMDQVAVAEPLPAVPSAQVQAQAQASAPEALVLRIHGWDTPADSAAAADGEMWIQINSSWQGAWR